MRISFVAKRNIVKTAFLVSGVTDISAATADDSFNSVSTSLLGVADADWMKVQGFTNAQNNGWHQANGASTANKIISTLNLANESAGNSITIQGHEHGEGITYDLETDAQQARPGPSSRRDEIESLGGQQHALLHHEAQLWQVTTGIIHKDNLKYWDEFFSSVRAKEPFTFDPFGTLAVPDNILSAVMQGDETLNQLGPLHYTYNFIARVLL